MEAGATGLAAAAVAAAAAYTSMVPAAGARAGAAAASARPSGRSRRNLCRVHSRIRKRDSMDTGGPQSHSRCLHIFRCSRERYHIRLDTASMCSRTRTILLQETAAAVSEEAVEAVEAAKCTGVHSRCNRCQEDIGSSRCTRSLARRLHRCQHRMNGRRYKNSRVNSSMNCMCSGTQLQVVTAVADSKVVAASARPSGRSQRNLCRAHSRICSID